MVTYLLIYQKYWQTGVSENTAKFNPGNSMYAYDIPKKTQQDLLEEKEYGDYK